MELRPFAVADAATVARWPTSPAEVTWWCGLRDCPVAARTVTGWQWDAGPGR
ncbi:MULTISPECIES: hypothetical protein [Streptomyces]